MRPPRRFCRSSTDARARTAGPSRSEEHTSELQSRPHLVCRLLLAKSTPHAVLYTLSLHDALPICDRAAIVEIDIGGADRRSVARLDRARIASIGFADVHAAFDATAAAVLQIQHGRARAHRRAVEIGRAHV